MTSAILPRNVNGLGVISDKNPTFQPFLGKNVSREFLKCPFFINSKNKNVATSGNNDFDFTEKFIGNRIINKKYLHATY